MFSGLYSAASGMIAQGANQDVIAQNLANAGVKGYKKERIVFRSFPDILLRSTSSAAYGPGGIDAETRTIGKVGTGTGINWAYTDFDKGQMNYTGVDTDLALMGDGFFSIELPDGQTAYSRDGSFNRDADGYLRNGEGNYVLGQQGRIQLGLEPFTVDRSGQILVKSENVGPGGVMGQTSTPVDQLQIVDFTNRDLLRPISGASFLLEAASPDEIIKAPDDLNVGQGYIEESNTNPVMEMVHMMDSYRNYEATARVVRAFDETQSRAIDLVLRRA
jgi:flagellar basal-body rod protein FlgF